MNKYSSSLGIAFLGVLLACSTTDSGNNNQDNDSSPPPTEINCDEIATNLSFPFDQAVGFALSHIVEDESSLYWYDADQDTGEGWLKSVSKEGGKVTILAGPLKNVNGFEIDETHLYWIDHGTDDKNGAVKKVSKDSSETTVLAEGFPLQPDGSQSPYDIFFPVSMVLDNDRLCFGEQVGGSAVRCVSKQGGSVEDIGRGEGFIPQSVTLDDQYFYILDTQSDGMILRLKKDGSSLDTLANGFASTQGLFSLVLDEGILYWVEITEPGQVFSMPAEGGGVSIIDDDLTNPRAVITHATDIYYVAGEGVFKVPKSGGTPDKAVPCSNINSSANITLDNTHIYVVDSGNMGSGDGKILKSDI